MGSIQIQTLGRHPVRDCHTVDPTHRGKEPVARQEFLESLVPRHQPECKMGMENNAHSVWWYWLIQLHGGADNWHDQHVHSTLWCRNHPCQKDICIPRGTSVGNRLYRQPAQGKLWWPAFAGNTMLDKVPLGKTALIGCSCNKHPNQKMFHVCDETEKTEYSYLV